MLGSSRRGGLVEPLLSEAEGAARRNELDFLSTVSRLRWIENKVRFREALLRLRSGQAPSRRGDRSPPSAICTHYSLRV